METTKSFEDQSIVQNRKQQVTSPRKAERNKENALGTKKKTKATIQKSNNHLCDNSEISLETKDCDQLMAANTITSSPLTARDQNMHVTVDPPTTAQLPIQYVPVNWNIPVRSDLATTSTEAKKNYDPMTTGVYGRLPSPTEIAYLQALPLPENEEEREAYILKFRNALLHPENEHQNNTDETGRAPISPESIQYLTVRGHTGKQFNKSGLIKASASINAPAALPSAEREFQKNRYRGDIVGGDKSSQESKMTEATKTVEPQLKQKIKKRTKRRPKKNNSKEIPMITAEDKVEQFPKPAVKYDNALARQGTSREPDYEWIPSPNHSDYLLPPIPQNEPLNENMINPDDAPDPSNYCLPSILQNEPLNENLIDTDDELSNEELQFLFSDSL